MLELVVRYFASSSPSVRGNDAQYIFPIINRSKRKQRDPHSVLIVLIALLVLKVLIALLVLKVLIALLVLIVLSDFVL